MSGDSTHWTVIRRAADGSDDARAEFVRRYQPVIRAYLGARWRGSPLQDQVEDASQQVFIDCFQENGALGRADPERGPGFRAFLYGIARNVARGIERSRARSRERSLESGVPPEAMQAKEDSLARVFDRAWAGSILTEAADRMLEQARTKGPAAVRRHELLQLRFGDNLPIREIAARWAEEPARVHHQYAQAREEFRRALCEVVRDLNGGGTEAVEAECRRLLAHFS